MLLGPGESWVTVVAYPAVSPAVVTAVHHAVFILWSFRSCEWFLLWCSGLFRRVGSVDI